MVLIPLEKVECSQKDEQVTYIHVHGIIDETNAGPSWDCLTKDRRLFSEYAHSRGDLWLGERCHAALASQIKHDASS